LSNFIKTNTRVVSPFLCPEIKLHLITPDCSLWKATEKDLKKIQLADPFWGFCWAGGQALARYLMNNSGAVKGQNVLDFGAGCGVDGIAALKAGAKRVLASDIDPLAVESIRLNAELNGLEIEATTSDLIGDPLDGFDTVLVGDMFYDAAFTKSLSDWFNILVRKGKQVLVGDPGRGNIDKNIVQTLASYMAPADVDVEGKFLRETFIYRWQVVSAFGLNH